MVTFPPSYSHKLQPLDRSVYGPLKRYYNATCNEWESSNPGKAMIIGLCDVAEKLGKAYSIAFVPEN